MPPIPLVDAWQTDAGAASARSSSPWCSIVDRADLAATRPAGDRHAVRGRHGLVDARPGRRDPDVRRRDRPPDAPRGRRHRRGAAPSTAVPEVDLAVRWSTTTPGSRPGPAAASSTAPGDDGRASLAIALRSTRGVSARSNASRWSRVSPWAAFRWSTVTPLADDRHAAGARCLRRRGVATPGDGLVGLHRSTRSGDGNEFAGLRAFRPGDRMRRINWPRSVRAGELQVNGTWADLDTHVALVVDATDDLGISEGIDGRASSLDVTVRAAGAIAEHYATRGERVSLRTFGARVGADRPAGSGRAQLRRVLDQMARIQPGGAGRHGTPRWFASSSGEPDDGDAVAADRTRGARSGGVARATRMSVVVVDTLPEHVDRPRRRPHRARVADPAARTPARDPAWSALRASPWSGGGARAAWIR